MVLVQSIKNNYRREISFEDFTENFIKAEKDEGVLFHYKDSNSRRYGSYPIFMDIDMDFNSPVDLEDLLNIHVEFGQEVVRILREKGHKQALKVTMSMRDGYKKGDLWHFGMHMWVTGLKVRLPFVQNLKQHLMKTDWKSLYGCETTNTKILDDHVFNRQNGLIVIGQKKYQGSKMVAGPQRIYFHENLAPNENISHGFVDPQLPHREIRLGLYKFLGEDPDVKLPRSLELSFLKPSKGAVKVKRNKKAEEFSLKEYLKIMPYPKNHEYNLIMGYFAYLGLNPYTTQKACNKAWNPKKPKETAKLIQKYYKDGSKVRKAGVKSILDCRGISYDPDLLWPPKVWVENDYRRFIGQLVNKAEVEDFLSKVVILARSKGAGVAWYVRQIRYLYQKGRRCGVPEWVREAHMPFTTDDAFCYNIEVLVEDKQGKETLVKKTMDTKPVMKQLAKFGKIRRYMDTTFAPPGSARIPGPDILNLWPGFSLESYTPQQSVDITKTLFYKMLKSVFGNQVEFMLNQFGFTIQFPGKRTKRITCLMSEEQGTGKSTVGIFLKYLVGIGLYQGGTIKQLTSRFAAHFMYKKIWFFDDITGISKHEANLLKPFATEEEISYEKKGFETTQAPEYADIYCSSNQTTPLPDISKFNHTTTQMVLGSTKQWNNGTNFTGNSMTSILCMLGICF